ncbi:MAG: PAS domain-containing protein, partial [Deltaproteobacteria bacterium]|nr:PAS domain-containing protein [Deltaproteobacteria bacterium]
MASFLIIDNKSNDLQRTEHLLRQLFPGCSTVTAPTGLEGIEHAESTLPDVILLGIDVPAIHASPVCTLLKTKSLTQYIPIIILTNDENDTNRHALALEAGADALLACACDAVSLKAQVTAMLRIKAAEDRLNHDKNQLAETVGRRTKELAESDNRLAQIVRANSIATFVINRDHRITHWNRACENLTGVPAADVLGTDKQWKAFYASPKPVMADIMVDAHPDRDIPHHYGVKAHPSALIAGAFEAEDFFSDLGKNGTWLFFTASPLHDAEGRITGAIETLQDISARKLAEEALLCEVATLEQELKGRSQFQSMIGKSKEMQEVYSLLENLADTDTTVLITGESGTGKEVVAREIHAGGARRDRQFVAVNCAAIPE